MTNLDPNALMENQTCPAIGYQSASICVPVTVTPYAQTGVTTTKCCGTPVVTPGIAVCGGIKMAPAPSPSPRTSAWRCPWSSAQ